MPAKSKLRRKVLAIPERPAAPILHERSVDLRGLGTFLRQTRSFRLALALYNDPIVRAETIRSLAADLASQKVHVLTLDLRETSVARTLLGKVEEIVKGANLPGGEPAAVMVVNLESQVEYVPELAQPGGPGTEFLQTANLHRELFAAVCPGPLVVWMTELLERALVDHAPDLWHWRSHTFDLRTHSARLEVASSESAAWPNDDPRRHPEDRLRRLEEELVAYRKIGSLPDEGRILYAMGTARFDGGDVKGARQDYEMALEIARKLDNPHALSASFTGLGSVHTLRGELHQAISTYEQALRFARKTGDRRKESSIVGNLGNVYDRLGDTEKAVEYYEQAQMLDHEMGDRLGESANLNNLGLVYANAGEFRKAISYYEQALHFAREVGRRRYEAAALCNLGIAYGELGEVYKALDYHEQARRIAREAGDPRFEARALQNSSVIFQKLGDTAEAIRRAEQALSVLKTIEDPLVGTVQDWLAVCTGPSRAAAESAVPSRGTAP